MIDYDELLTRAEAATALRLSVRGLDRISESALERVTIGRRVLYRRRAIVDFISRHASGGTERQASAA